MQQNCNKKSNKYAIKFNPITPPPFYGLNRIYTCTLELFNLK